MTKIEVGDTVEILEGVCKGFQAKVTGKNKNYFLLGDRVSYAASPEKLKLIKKAKIVTH